MMSYCITAMLCYAIALFCGMLFKPDTTPTPTLTLTLAMQSIQRRPPHAYMHGQSVPAEKDASLNQSTVFIPNYAFDVSVSEIAVVITCFLSTFVYHRKVIGNACISATTLARSFLSHAHTQKQKQKSRLTYILNPSSIPLVERITRA